MLLGFNDNIAYKDNVYHVQTEDNGLKNPVIITLIYSKGEIISSKKTGYAHVAGDSDYLEKVLILMKEQHREMINRLLAGEFTAERNKS
ncbi:MAG: hypothetical protein AB1638_09815 [Nitrospirota bacterium]